MDQAQEEDFGGGPFESELPHSTTVAPNGPNLQMHGWDGWMDGCQKGVYAAQFKARDAPSAYVVEMYAHIWAT